MIRMDIAWLYALVLISCTVICVVDFFEKLEEKKNDKYEHKEAKRLQKYSSRSC